MVSGAASNLEQIVKMKRAVKIHSILIFLLGLIPLFVSCYLGMEFLGGGWTTFWIMLLGWVTLSLVQSTLGCVVQWIVFYVSLKPKLIKFMYSDLVRHNFPDPKDYPENYVLDEYFEDVSSDTKVQVDTRLMARELATLIKEDMNNGFQKTFQISQVVGAALQQYSKSKSQIDQ